MSDEQRVAIVTGANRGIGFEACRGLARHGLKVVVTARDEAKAEAAAAKLGRDGADAVPRRLDVTDPESIAGFAAAAGRDFGRADVLVNNAGIFRNADVPYRPGRWDELGRASALAAKIGTLRENMETHVYGPLLLCQAFAPLMRARGYGRIVNVSSGSGQLDDMDGGWPGYRVSKAGLNALTRILAAELEDTGILVNSMCPGSCRTRMGSADAPRSAEQGADTIVWLATLPDDGPSGLFFRDRKPIPW